MTTIGRPARFDPVSMAEDEDWLLRPVLRGMCRYESLVNGALSLADVALMNEALEVEAENAHRAARKAG